MQRHHSVEPLLALSYAVFRKCDAGHTFKPEEPLSYRVPSLVSLINYEILLPLYPRTARPRFPPVNSCAVAGIDCSLRRAIGIKSRRKWRCGELLAARFPVGGEHCRGHTHAPMGRDDQEPRRQGIRI